MAVSAPKCKCNILGSKNLTMFAFIYDIFENVKNVEILKKYSVARRDGSEQNFSFAQNRSDDISGHSGAKLIFGPSQLFWPHCKSF